MSFLLSGQADINKIFLVQSSELEGRFDPFCYIPELVELDRKLKLKTKYCLKDFAISYSGGATPKKDNPENYATKENGVPFIRVQNLSVTGELQLDDLVYISKETHETSLKRSQLKEYDLLVKITGVGRMAVASVVPSGFEGNINQHIVVIRTGSMEISENIAAFLNLDSTEKLATKRATGGTRPALDYPALLSIPVINSSIISKKTKSAVLAKKQKEAEAERLLASIDDYLLGELGISLPVESENTIQNRTFIRYLNNTSDERLDPFYWREEFINNKTAATHGIYKTIPLKSFVNGELVKGSLPNQSQKEGSNRVIQINCIDFDGCIRTDDLLTAKDIYTDKQRLVKNDILIVITGATIGKIAYWDYEGDFYLGGDLVKFKTTPEHDPRFVYSFLRSSIIQTEIKRNITGATNGHLSPADIGKFLIPIPPLSEQQEIAEHITSMRNQAKQLQAEAKEGLELAKAEIEAMILGVEV